MARWQRPATRVDDDNLASPADYKHQHHRLDTDGVIDAMTDWSRDVDEGTAISSEES